MAVGLDGFEKKLDKLERFFKKRRGFARGFLALDGCPASRAAMSDTVFRTFPQPSFIRPTSTRMLAREELSPNSRRFNRSGSLPENYTDSSSETSSQLAPQTTTESHHVEPRSSLSLVHPPRIPRRTSSLSPGRRSASLASLGELLELSFAPSKSQAATMELVKARQRSGSVSPKTPPKNNNQYSDSLIQPPISRSCYLASLATPPPSVEHDKPFGPEAMSYQKPLALLPPAQLTPAPSPRLIPLPEPGADELKMETKSAAQRPQSLDVSALIIKSQRKILRRSTSLSMLQIPNPKKRMHPVLREPSLGDFLTLSDDDIADNALAAASTPSAPAALASPATPTASRVVVVSNPPSFALPPNPPCPSTPPGPAVPAQNSTGSRLLTLSPPLASRSATSAAFEAARIATKYKFDLVYVVNLWPNHMVSSRDWPAGPPSPPATPETCDSGASITSPRSARVGMNGRLLAAHGLQKVPSPFRIVAPVHMKVLRSDSWLEFRAEDAAPEEFQHGFMHSFFTGHCPNPETRGMEMPKTRRGPVPNRGIIFAAYRLPHSEGVVQPEVNIDELQDDAGNLVNMLLNRHQATTRSCITVPAPSNALVRA
ncbi:hypothetical protein B0T18DRAFT_424676 [Schizothecium vesticola]|uniref:Uncharacterized protein n=1 Tax=Schizothecium vesticola TaxID=314040 RepID=A0AA40FAI5_9PEZI|nr:hypothetical protein B0T18DRAFT_424676 [Schizothecium vesticola]